MNRKELIENLDGFIWNNSTLHYQASCYLKENPDDFIAQFALYASAYMLNQDDYNYFLKDNKHLLNEEEKTLLYPLIIDECFKESKEATVAFLSFQGDLELYQERLDYAVENSEIIHEYKYAKSLNIEYNPVNQEIAFESFQRLAKLGHAPSLYELSIFYREGIGRDVDLEKADYYLNLAQEQGYQKK